MVAAPAQRFVALDSLRGIAALAVVGYHLNFVTGLFSGTLFRNAYLAVDFFFVLSGFVIAGSYGAKLQGGMPVSRFMGLRLGRLYPLHFFMLMIFLAQALVGLLLALAKGSAYDPFTGGQSLAKLAASLLLLQSFEMPRLNRWNDPSWSIATEVWLYCAAALAWRLAGRRGWLIWLICLIVAGILMERFFDYLAAPVSDMMLRGVLGFGLGVCCWEVWPRLRPALPIGAAASLLEIAVVALALLTVLNIPEGGFQYVLASAVFFLVVLVFAAEGGIVSRILKLWGFVWLGTLSFSIYMVHVLIVARVLGGLRRFGLETLVPMPNGEVGHSIASGALAADLAGIGLLLLSVCAAWFTWRFIEEPCRKWSRRKFAAPVSAGQ